MNGTMTIADYILSKLGIFVENEMELEFTNVIAMSWGIKNVYGLKTKEGAIVGVAFDTNGFANPNTRVLIKYEGNSTYEVAFIKGANIIKDKKGMSDFMEMIDLIDKTIEIGDMSMEEYAERVKQEYPNG